MTGKARFVILGLLVSGACASVKAQPLNKPPPVGAVTHCPADGVPVSVTFDDDYADDAPVRSDDGMIECRRPGVGSCTAFYPPGTTVSLHRDADTGIGGPKWNGVFCYRGNDRLDCKFDVFGPTVAEARLIR